MSSHDFVVFGIFQSRKDAQGAVDSLDKDGFEPEDISILELSEIFLIVHTSNSAWCDMAQLALESCQAKAISVIENPGRNWRLAPLRQRLNLVYPKLVSVQKD